jgi:hypothetical protein
VTTAITTIAQLFLIAIPSRRFHFSYTIPLIGQNAIAKLDLLHKSEKGEAFADKNPDFTDKSGRKCSLVST